jgi:hypothetical protein
MTEHSKKEEKEVEVTEQKEEIPKEDGHADEEITEEEAEKLPFPNAAIVRLMKSRMDGEKMIKKEVKIAMNKWLGKMCIEVAKEMNKVPYVMLHLHEFRNAIEMYENIAEFQKEKERILAHMNAIKKDIEKLEGDIGKLEETQLL